MKCFFVRNVGGQFGDGHEAEDHRHPPVHHGRQTGLPTQLFALNLQKRIRRIGKK